MPSRLLDRDDSPVRHSNRGRKKQPPARGAAYALPELLTAYADAVEAFFGADHLGSPWCIQATRTAFWAFDAFCVRIEPVAVFLQAYNAAAAAREGFYRGAVPAGQVPFVYPCGVPDLAKAPRVGRVWDGHMIALVDGRHIVDAAVAQCAHPGIGVDTPDVLVAPNAALSDAGEQQGIVVPSSGVNSVLVYTRLPRDARAFEFGAWRDPIIREHAAEVARHMRIALDAR